jgi:hypothetical protein
VCGSRNRWMVRLRWWEVLLGIVPLVIALLWLAGGLVIPGVVLVCLLAFAVASRARIVERQVAGAHARTRAVLALTRSLALLVILVVVLALLWVVDRRDWTDGTPGLIAAYALSGLAIYLLRDVARYADEAVDYFIGGDAERRVAKVLEPLRELGWTIAHNVPREHRGNLGSFPYGTDGRIRDRNEEREVPRCGPRPSCQQRDLGQGEVRRAVRDGGAVRADRCAWAATEGTSREGRGVGDRPRAAA